MEWRGFILHLSTAARSVSYVVSFYWSVDIYATRDMSQAFFVLFFDALFLPADF